MSSSEMTVEAFDAMKRGSFVEKLKGPELPGFSDEEREELKNIKGPNTIPDFMVKHVKDFVEINGSKEFENKNDYDVKRVVWLALLKENRGRKYRICG